MSKYIPVDPEKWAAMVQAQSENRLLKAEVERLRKLFADTERLMLLDGEYEAAKVGTYARLKAEVERLTKAHSDALADFWNIHKGYFDLKAEVEQLRKEGKQP